MEKSLKIKKGICKVIVIIMAILGSIPLFMFFILFMFFVLFYAGTNSDIGWIENITYAINDNIVGSNHYNQSVIKDKIVLNGGKFVITEMDDKFNLIMYTKYNKVQAVFLNGVSWNVSDDKIYLVGNDEYAVTYTDVDERVRCKVMLLNNNFLINEIASYPEDIKILDNFDEFTKDEQKILLDIKENGSLFQRFYD